MLKFLNYGVFMSLKIVFILAANSADPDEMPPKVAFHLGLHCLPKYMLTSIQNERVNFLSNNILNWYGLLQYNGNKLNVIFDLSLTNNFKRW